MRPGRGTPREESEPIVELHGHPVAGGPVRGGPELLIDITELDPGPGTSAPGPARLVARAFARGMSRALELTDQRVPGSSATRAPTSLFRPPAEFPAYNGDQDPMIAARLGLLCASHIGAVLNFNISRAPTALELLGVPPATTRIIFCSPRVEAMARINPPAEEAECTKAEKALKANAHSHWHTGAVDLLPNCSPPRDAAWSGRELAHR
jgi:hypothetical protein